MKVTNKVKEALAEYYIAKGQCDFWWNHLKEQYDLREEDIVTLDGAIFRVPTEEKSAPTPIRPVEQIIAERPEIIEPEELERRLEQTHAMARAAEMDGIPLPPIEERMRMAMNPE